MAKKLTEAQVAELLNNELSNQYKIEPQDATNEQIYNASVKIVTELLQEEQLKFARASKKANKKQ